MKISEQYSEFIEHLRQNSSVVAAILVGSYAKGLQTSSSDIDAYIIVDDKTPQSTLDELKTVAATMTSGQIDLSVNGIQTMSNFKDYATIGTTFEWDRYNLVHSIIEFDKSNGEISAILNAKSVLSKQEAESTLRTYLGPFVNMTYRSVSSTFKDDPAAARLDAAQAVKPLINCLFALRHRVTPFNKYLAWEIDKKPLDYSMTGNLIDEIVKFSDADIETQKFFFNLIKNEALNAGSNELFEAWGQKLDILHSDE